MSEPLQSRSTLEIILCSRDNTGYEQQRKTEEGLCYNALKWMRQKSSITGREPILNWMSYWQQACCQASNGETEKFLKKEKPWDGTSLLVQWLSLPANAEDTGSIPGPGRPHMLWSNWAHVPQLLSSHTLEPVLCNKRSCYNEKPAHCN